MAPVRPLTPSNLVLPAVIAVMLGLLVGFEIAPAFQGGGPGAASVDGLSLYRPPSTVVVTPPSVEGDGAVPIASSAVDDPALDGLPALVIGDADVLSARAPARVSTVSLDDRPRGWVASYITPGDRRTEVLVAGDGDDPRWAGRSHTTADIGGVAVVIAESSDGATHVTFETAGRLTGVSTVGLDRAALTAVVTSLAAHGVAALPRRLPAGLELVGVGRGTPVTRTSYRARYERDDWYVELRVDAASPLAADPAVAAGQPTSVQLAAVGSSTAVVRAIGADGGDTTGAQAWYEVTWWNGAGAHITLLSRGATLSRVLELARSVRPAAPTEWDPMAVRPRG